MVSSMLKNKKNALYLTRGIAVYKVVYLLLRFIKNETPICVAMNDSDTKFVTPMTFQILSSHEVYVDTFIKNNPAHVSHVDLSDWAYISIVAPATSNTIGKMAYGLADNFVTSALLATASPIFVV